MEKIKVSIFKGPQIVNIQEGKNLRLIITHWKSNSDGVSEQREKGHC